MRFSKSPLLRLAVVWESDEKMESVLGDFGVFRGGFEVEGTEARLDGCFLEEFWIKVGDCAGWQMLDAEIWISGALDFSCLGFREVAGEVGMRVDLNSEGIFKEGRDFVDTTFFVCRGVGFAEFG